MKFYGIIKVDTTTGAYELNNRYLFSRKEDAEIELKNAVFSEGAEYRIVEYRLHPDSDTITNDYKKFIDNFNIIKTDANFVKLAIWKMLNGRNSYEKIDSLEDILLTISEILNVSYDGAKLANDKNTEDEIEPADKED